MALRKLCWSLHSCSGWYLSEESSNIKFEEFSILNSAPFKLPFYFPHLCSVLKSIFGPLSGPFCVGRVTKGIYIFFPLLQEAAVVLKHFQIVSCNHRSVVQWEQRVGVPLPFLLQDSWSTSTWIERSGCCQFSKRINCCGLLHKVNMPCLFLWLLSLFRFYFLHVMPSAGFFLTSAVFTEKKNVCKKTWW